MIWDVQNLKRMIKYELALFAGAGNGILAFEHILGIKTVAAVEKDPYCIRVLMQRQNDGALDAFPIWDEIESFTEDSDQTGWIIRELHAMRHNLIISAGFPCQDISAAGKGAGLDGEKSALYWEAYRLFRFIRPKQIWLENSPMLTRRGLGEILQSLAEIGYDARWTVLEASDVGGNHYRKRIWILAQSYGIGGAKGIENAKAGFDNQAIEKRHVTYAHNGRWQEPEVEQKIQGPEFRGESLRSNWWATESPIPGVDDGIAHRVDRLRAVGNGQVPGVAALAYTLLNQQFNNQ